MEFHFQAQNSGSKVNTNVSPPPYAPLSEKMYEFITRLSETLEVNSPLQHGKQLWRRLQICDPAYL